MVKKMKTKIAVLIISAVTLLMLSGCQSPCNCGYAQAGEAPAVQIQAEA